MGHQEYDCLDYLPEPPKKDCTKCRQSILKEVKEELEKPCSNGDHIWRDAPIRMCNICNALYWKCKGVE